MDFKMFTCSYVAFLKSIKENLEERRNFDGVTFFFKFGFTPCKAEQPLGGMALQEKEAQKG